MIFKDRCYVIGKVKKADYYRQISTFRSLGLSFDVPKKCLFVGDKHSGCLSVLFEGQEKVNSMTEYHPDYTGKYYNVVDWYFDILVEVKKTFQEELEI